MIYADRAKNLIYFINSLHPFLLFPETMANPSPAKSIGDPGITPLSPSHSQVSFIFCKYNALLVLLWTLYVDVLQHRFHSKHRFKQYKLYTFT